MNLKSFGQGKIEVEKSVGTVIHFRGRTLIEKKTRDFGYFYLVKAKQLNSI